MADKPRGRPPLEGASALPSADVHLTRDELLARLRELKDHDDPERGHYEADELLLQFIADDEIRRAFEVITRWYT